MNSPTLYGLIGYPLTHSFSPGFFNDKFKENDIHAEYRLFPIADIAGFTSLIEANPDLRGLNVTIPHKEAVLSFLDAMSIEAQIIGAVNCIAMSNGRAIGYNTDVVGFERSLVPLLKEHHTHALVLGTGGASKAVMYVLHKLGIESVAVSRKGQGKAVLSYDEVTPAILEKHTLIINTTPLGMYPDIEGYPGLDYSVLGARHLLYDLIYNPEKTRFLLMGEANGATIKNGLEMLILQAEASWEIWNKHP